MSSSSAQTSTNASTVSQTPINYINDYVMVPRASLASSTSSTTTPTATTVAVQLWPAHNSFCHSPGCASCSLCALSTNSLGSSSSVKKAIRMRASKVKNGVMKTTITTANTITIGTSAALNTALALTINGSNEWSSFAALYDEYKVKKVRIELNAVRPSSSSASALVFWDAYDPTVSSGKTYDKVADYTNSRLLPFNATHCKSMRVVKPIGEVNTSNEVVNKGWVPCSQASNLISGTYLLSTTSVLSGTPLDVYYKVVWEVEFRMRIGS